MIWVLIIMDKVIKRIKNAFKKKKTKRNINTDSLEKNETSSQDMLLKHSLIMKAITKKQPIKNVFNSPLTKLLWTYSISDYITTDHIPEITINGSPAKQIAQVFFEEHQNFSNINIDELLIQLDDKRYNQAFKTEKRFPEPVN